MEKPRRGLEKAEGAWPKGEGPCFAQVGRGLPSSGSYEQWKPPVYSQSRQVALDRRVLAANRCVCVDPGAAEAESYKVLRAQILQRARQQGWNSFMVTSAVPGEGKTTTAVNLALCCAMEFNQTVMLVDCNLRRQGVHRIMGYDSSAGLADHLLYDRPLNEVIVWPGIEKLSIISGGSPVAESAELLGSPKMRALIAEMKGRYADRILLFDAPSLLEGADAIVLAPLVDAVIVVVRSGRTSLQEVQRALGFLPAEKILGLVLNRSDASRAGRSM